MPKPVWFLCLLGLTIALAEAGCGSDSTNPNATTSSSGTTASSSGGGHGGAGGGTGGTAGAGGSCGGGAGGGEACFSCISDLETGDCQMVYATCAGIPSCQGWLDCVETCTHDDNSVDCYHACDQQFLSSNSANQNVKSCACASCPTDCKALCPCGG